MLKIDYKRHEKTTTQQKFKGSYKPLIANIRHLQ